MKTRSAASAIPDAGALHTLCAVLFVVLMGLPPSSQAQKPEHPLLESIWNPMRGPGFSIGGLQEVEPPMFSAAGQEWADAFELLHDETIHCVENGIIRQLIHPYPQETRQGLDMLLIMYEA